MEPRGIWREGSVGLTEADGERSFFMLGSGAQSATIMWRDVAMLDYKDIEFDAISHTLIKISK